LKRAPPPRGFRYAGWKFNDRRAGVLTVDRLERIRRAYYVDGESIRRIAREGHHHRRTVRKAQVLQ